MDENQQISARIGAFLNSSDLTDSPVARSLYDAFANMNNNAAKRLIACDVLLQKKQKIEAVMAAQQTPNLFEVLELLFFPGRNTLTHLAELYDWQQFDSINQESVVRLRKAFSEMDDLRPLLTEFRRIARTDQIRNKLLLLREIAKLDKDNPEWRISLYDVENQYLSKLIDEAKSTIIRQDFDRLEEIHQELTNSHWEATVPTVVLQKIERLVKDNRIAKIKKEAIKLLDMINSAYASFDVTALQDAIFCWENHCSSTGYTPDSNEKRQLDEAADYLAKEKSIRQQKQEFQNLLEHIMGLIDQASPLDNVEKVYSKLLAAGLELPAYVSNRVKQYRMDIEREKRAATIIKSCKIIGAAALIMLTLIGSGMMIVQYVIENKQAANLHQAVKDGDVTRAEAILADISATYPDLVNKPKITREKAALHALRERENKRTGELKKIFAELDALKKVWPLADTFQTKLTTAGTMAKSVEEKNRLRELKIWYEDAFNRMTHEAEDNFYKQLSTLRGRRESVLTHIENEEFSAAEKAIIQIEYLVAEIKKIKYLDPSLLEDNKDLINSGDTLRRMYEQHSERKYRMDRAFQAIAGASDLNTLESSVKLFQEISTGSDNAVNIGKELAADLNALKMLMRYQSGAVTLEQAEVSSVLFFKDLRKIKKMQQALLNGRNRLRQSFDSLQKNVNKTTVCFARFQTANSLVDIYFNSHSISRINQELRIQRDDGALIKITEQYNGYYKIVSGEDTYQNCKLIVPAQISDIRSLRKTVAAHQKLIEKFFFMPAATPENLIEFSNKCLQLILRDPLCAPFWKVQLSLQILNVAAPLDISTTRHFVQLQTELEKLKALDNNADNPLYNKFLNEAIARFLSTYDPSLLTRSTIENQYLYKFFIDHSKRRFNYLGLKLNTGKKTQYTINPALKDKVADVYCFDEARQGCLLVGKLDKGTLLLDDDFKDRAAGRLLFTTDPPTAVSTARKELLKNGTKINLQKINWPEFWPTNIRGF